MKKTISLIGSSGIPARYGGFETLVENICTHLKFEYEITVYCSETYYDKSQRSKSWNGINRVFIPLKANGIQSILYDLLSLIKASKNAEIIILLGGGAGLFLPLLKLLFLKGKIVLHPDGYEWKRQKWNFLTRSFLRISINTACRVADRIIIDNSALLDYYKQYSNKLYKATYGGDQHLSPSPRNTKNYWLTIARAEDENNLLEIAKAFSVLKNKNWTLISNFNDTKYGRKLKAFCDATPNITLIPKVYDNEILQTYYNDCFGYIHGHSTGGTNPTLTAAMWLNKPLICHDNEFNRATTHSKACFFKNGTDLVTHLRNNRIYNKDIISEATKIAKEEYRWQKVIDDYKKIISFYL